MKPALHVPVLPAVQAAYVEQREPYHEQGRARGSVCSHLHSVLPNGPEGLGVPEAGEGGPPKSSFVPFPTLSLMNMLPRLSRQFF